MPKYPAELFGFDISDLSEEAEDCRIQRCCPFSNGKCIKDNGVCSVRFQDDIVAICPNRFLENETIFREIAEDYFGTTNNLLLFREVYSGDKSLGTFDYVLVRHRTLSSEIEDFLVVELQAVDTTSTGKLTQALEDFAEGAKIRDRNYGFGLNWANVGKRSFIQMLNKGRVLENWGHTAYWVIQRPTHEYMLNAYGLGAGSEAHPEQATTVFMVYDLVGLEDRPGLVHSGIYRTNIPLLLEAFSRNPQIPSKDAFLRSLNRRTDMAVRLRLSLE